MEVDYTKLDNSRCSVVWILKKYIKIYGSILIVTCIIIKIICAYATRLDIYNVSEVANLHESLGIDMNRNYSFLPKKFMICSQVGLGIVKFTKNTAFNQRELNNFNISLVDSHPNIPLFLLKSNTISTLMPDVHEIRWTGMVWQESWRNYPKFLLYSAHFDSRGYKCDEKKECSNVFVRILALYDGTNEPAKYSCHLWFNEKDPPVLTVVHRYDIIDWQGFSNKYLIPYMITCAVPKIDNEFRVPVAVSLVNNSCLAPSNVLKVTGIPSDVPSNSSINLKKKRRKETAVGICGPALYYFTEDFSHRLIEWIEIMYALGVSKLILYNTVNHRNVENVLRHYENLGKLKTVSFHYPPPYADDPAIRKIWTIKERKELFALENIYFTDCVLRYKDTAQFLAHFDPDEVPILKKHKNFEQLISYLQKLPKSYKPAYYHLKWKTFYPDLPLGNSAQNISKRFYALTHTNRPKSFVKKIDYNGKSLYDTDKVSSRRIPRKEFSVDPSVAYTAHFRERKCGEECKNIELREETFLLQFKDKIIENTDFVLKKLGINIVE
ncbi:hypothetical protein Avbf_09644 [Armadillidium vulgare]|nr:hypothetical protein Avbf_09644 [Armadillidium vulgare]